MPKQTRWRDFIVIRSMTLDSQGKRHTPPVTVTFFFLFSLFWACSVSFSGHSLNGWTKQPCATIIDSSAARCFICHLIPEGVQYISCRRCKNLCSRILLLIAPHNSTSRHSSTLGSDSEQRQLVLRLKLLRKHIVLWENQLSPHRILALTCDMITYDLYTSRTHHLPAHHARLHSNIQCSPLKTLAQRL